jgi:CheY-like chemotaxis protein
MKCKPILIVDDDLDIRSNLVLALQMEGHEVFEAGNGVEALDFLTQGTNAERIGCILLDLMMPKMDGLQFLAILQSQYADTLAKIPIIIATAQGSSASTSQIPNTVAKLQKPMDLDQLYAAIEKHCQKEDSL